MHDEPRNSVVVCPMNVLPDYVRRMRRAHGPQCDLGEGGPTKRELVVATDVEVRKRTHEDGLPQDLVTILLLLEGYTNS